MMEGQQHKRATMAVEDGHFLRHAVDVGVEIGKGEHHTFGRTRRAGGIYNECRVLVFILHTGLVRSCWGLLVIVNQTDFCRHPALFDGCTQDIEAQTRRPNTCWAAVGEDVSHITDRRTGVHRYCDAAMCPNGIEGINPTLTVLTENDGALPASGRGILRKNGDTLKEFAITHLAFAGDNRYFVVFFEHTLLFVVRKGTNYFYGQCNIILQIIQNQIQKAYIILFYRI